MNPQEPNTVPWDSLSVEMWDWTVKLLHRIVTLVLIQVSLSDLFDNYISVTVMKNTQIVLQYFKYAEIFQINP